MNRRRTENRVLFNVLATLVAVLSVVGCVAKDDREDPELMVSLYIPDAVMTKAGAGYSEAEKTISTLQVWVFLADGGDIVSYGSFASDLADTGLKNGTVTRFGLPLTEAMFTTLTTPVGSPAQRPKVDVYAVANAESATGSTLGPHSSRDDLDQAVVTGFGGSTQELALTAPATGLPLSGVIRNADVTGGYPVLNITTLKLTRAVSKIRFVFCQQETPAYGSNPAAPVNDQCKIISIAFDGTDNGKDCQIAEAEKLFTTNTISPGTLFDIGDPKLYTPLSASVTGDAGAPLIPNNKLTCAENPEEFCFRSPGHETESAAQYEARLDAAIGAGSQVGPIYLRETDKTISGTITYRTSADGPDQIMPLSMEAGEIMARNHSWVVYAYFADETKTLQLKVTVLPWEWTNVPVDFTSGSVNVIRRFTVAETSPATFAKVQKNDFFDVFFWHTVDAAPNTITGDIIIATPVGAKLHMIPVPGVTEGHTLVPDAILVDPPFATIYPNYSSPDNPDGRIEHCKIQIRVSANTSYSDADLEGNYINLHFCVEIGDGVRYIDLGSESIDYYRFILSEDWANQSSNDNGGNG